MWGLAETQKGKDWEPLSFDALSIEGISLPCGSQEQLDRGFVRESDSTYQKSIDFISNSLKGSVNDEKETKLS